MSGHCDNSDHDNHAAEVSALTAERESLRAQLEAATALQASTAKELVDAARWGWQRSSEEASRRATKAEAQLEAAKKLMRSIAENDKTPDYGYTGKTCLNRVGAHPGMGTRWATPRDMARDFLLHNDKKEVAS